MNNAFNEKHDGPCKDCDMRELNCHSICNLYNTFKKEHEEFIRKRANEKKEEKVIWRGEFLGNAISSVESKTRKNNRKYY